MTAATATAVALFDMQRLLTDTAASQAGRTALICDGEVITFGDLQKGSLAVAGALNAWGIGAGDRVAYLGKNAPEYVEILFGAARLGAVTVPLNWRLAAPEIAGVLQDSTARVLITAGEFVPLIEEFAAAAGPDFHLVVIGEAAAGSLPSVAYADWLGAAPVPPAPHPVAPDDDALQIYTSGTTGKPKGVVLSYANLAATIPDAVAGWQLDADGVMLSVLPWFHIAGTGPVLGAVWLGAATVMLNDARPEVIIEQLTRHRVTTVILVSSLLHRVLECPAIRDADLSTLKVMAYGAAPISQSTLHLALEILSSDLFQVYGLTETGGTISFLPSSDHDLSLPTTATRLQSCGKPLADVEVRLIDPATGEDAGPDGVGEIWVRSPRVMTGYWLNPDATAEAITPEGWFRTGDMASQDADGYLYLKDRIKDMIVSGGENIYPAEIENVLLGCPEVAEVTVIGVPSSWGESPRAIVVPNPGVSPDEATAAAIIEFARARLAHYKCPTAVDFAEQLPRNASGKVLKHVLREGYWRGLDRRVN